MESLENLFHHYVAQFLPFSKLSEDELVPEKTVNLNHVDERLESFSRLRPKEAEILLQNFMGYKKSFLDDMQNRNNEGNNNLSSALWCQLRNFTKTEELTHTIDTLVIKRPVIVLSKCLSKLEHAMVKTSTISAIHIDAEHCLYIDCSLEKAIWQGKNITASSRKIECVWSNLHWDVSGESYDEKQQTANNAVGPGEHGCDGENGKNGENGGTISMTAEEYVGKDKLSIFTNGGNAGHGVHGGNGADGENGTNGSSVSEDFFKLWLCPLGKNGISQENLETFIQEMGRECEQLNTPLVKGYDQFGNKTPNSEDERYILWHGELRSNILFSLSHTVRGNGKYPNTCVLLKGKRGTPGKHGGSAGLGGKAGLPGGPGCVTFLYENGIKYNIYDSLKVYNDPGRAGKNGRNGRAGKCGRNGTDGLDIGLTVSSSGAWFSTSPATKLYKHGKYEVEFSANEQENSVWLGARSGYLSIKPV